jgi:hypothetical protein
MLPPSGFLATTTGSCAGFAADPSGLRGTSRPVALAGAIDVGVSLHLTTPSLEISAAGTTSHEHPKGRHSSGVMEGGVGIDAKNFKVLGSVVVLDAVSVMDMLVPFQRTSEHAFHDEAVLKFVPVTGSNGHVAI